MAIKRPGHKDAAAKLKKRERDRTRGSAASRGYGTRHRAVRRALLAGGTMCVQCKRLGIIRGATVLDHIVPFKGDATLQWDESNRQPLCKQCHDEKTATESGGWGKAR